MKSVMCVLVLTFALLCSNANARNDSLDAAIGAGVGGALGAAIGNELGGRDGAMIGGALGATAGAGVATGGGGHHVQPYHDPYRRDVYREPVRVPNYQYQPSGGAGYHCPPGQAKKGRC